MAAAVASLANQARDWAPPHVQWDALYLAFEATGYLITGEVPQRMGSVPWCNCCVSSLAQSLKWSGECRTFILYVSDLRSGSSVNLPLWDSFLRPG